MHRAIVSTPRSQPLDLSRRRLLQAASAAAFGAAGAAVPTRHAWAQGSDKPEKEEVRIGFIPLTDCASRRDGLGAGLRQEVRRQDRARPRKRRWAGVRDKLVNGELDMAHVLYGLIYGVHLGIGGPKKDMAVLMNLNNNGQAITLSQEAGRQGRGRRRRRWPS